MTEAGTVATLLAGIGQAMLPLREALASPESFAGLLRRLGWRSETIPQPVKDLGSGVDTLYDALRGLLGDGGINLGGSHSGPLEPPRFSADGIGRVLGATQAVIEGIRGIAAAPDSAIPEPLRADGFREKFPKQLIDHLVVDYLRHYQPPLAFALTALGVIRIRFVPAAGNRPPYRHVSLDLTELPEALADPSGPLKAAFGWGEQEFDYPALAGQIDNLLMALGMRVTLPVVDEPVVEAVQGTVRQLGDDEVRAVRAVLFEQVSDPAAGEGQEHRIAELRLMPLPADGDRLPGVALLPSFDGELGLRIPLGPDIAITIRSDLDLRGGVALLLRPGRPIETVVGFAGEGAPVRRDGSIEVAVERENAGGEPVLLIGARDGTRLQFRKIGGTGGVRLAGGGADVYAEFELDGLEFVFSPGGADGFIAKILPGGGFTVGADLTVGISHRDGFYFRGASNLELQVPAHIKIGPVEVQGLTISAAPSADGLPVALGATIKADLGPVKAVVERIGLSANLVPKPNMDGNLGPLDVSLGFLPPKGVGLSVNAGIVSGGGYLYFDPDHGEYAGALELDFAGLVALKGIGLITTRMPDGSSGFSLLIVITAEFAGGGIQLGFGFTLLGVGGIIGLNRRMDLGALVEGVVSGAIESVMFPRDVVANAPRIISDLRRFFPPEEGTFLIGPMAKLGWGTPALVTVSLGIVIEIPPGTVAILGVLRCVLPREELPLLVLQVDFVGAFEPDKSRLWFFAKMRDSRILTMTIDGGMGLLVAWGGDADLVLSVGGFHPSFKPPPLPFPVPQRLTVDILNSPGRLVRVTGYFAVTSNTVQFGAAVELRLGFNEFGIHGHLGFDALFRFSPFAFVVEISAGVSLKAFGVGVFGIDLHLQLEGPTPWRAHGRGSISLLFFEISADFDITWGEERDTTLPPVQVMGLLESEIRKTDGWQTRLPGGGANPLVTLRQLTETDDLVLHPLGTLFIHQRALPLGTRIDRVGGQRPSDGKRFTVAPEQGSGLVKASDTGERFPMAQFQDMDDAAKLSRPAFENADAGLELTADKGALAATRVVRRSARYELHIMDADPPRPAGATGTATPASAAGSAMSLASGAGSRRPPRLYRAHPAVFGQLLEGSSTARSPLSQREAQLRRPYDAAESVQVTGDRFVIAYLRNNHQAFPPAASGASTAGFGSQTAAADAMAEWIRDEPRLAGRLHVIREAEAAGGAAAQPGTWTAANPAPSAVTGTEAVLLGGGNVLISGGADGSGAPVAGTMLFDPVAATWSAGPALKTARRGHTTTALPDGRVVVAGGVGADGTPLASVEVYDPVARTWTSPQQTMRTARHGHSATVVDGKLLVIGGTGARGGQGRATLTSAETLDPATLTWTGLPPMAYARTGHQAVPLPEGRVFVIGGALLTGRGERAMTYCEIYDPSTKTWGAAAALIVPRKGHQATALRDGKVLVTGGDAVPAVPHRPGSLAAAELYDPAAKTWTRVADLPGGRSGHRGVATRSGRVLVVGGTDRVRSTAGYRNAVLFDPSSGTWTATGPLGAGRWDFPAVVLADGRVLAVGGVALAGPAAPGPDPAVLDGTAEIYLP
ncbi:DUF6603 domain-containing protein [Actinomadura rubrisoli]|uniref:DUF6603 domain-containing protein n=1 Tax=Actinomadura rubrisoli TaxID=2530368 RepID=A0A4R5BW26_9ACTN|nr:DUF6603 domain-containing protein [Actinomadura rubrisoli]TDD90405.1 hypothetical protein E1298_13170 [Actinomadura rubrisoli]